MPHLSSDSVDLFVLLNGEMSPNAFATASLRVGDIAGGADPAVSSQFVISAQRETAHGRLVWDADHRRNGVGSPFFSIAPVRFHLTPNECLLSVGTADYVRTSAAPYRWIEKIQIGAITGTSAPARSIAWDFIEIDFSYASGRTDTHRSNCLPRVITSAPLRRSVQAHGPARTYPQQFTEFSTHSRQIVEVKIRGQVTLRANDCAADPSYPLLADDLQGRIQVFTDAGGMNAQ